MVKGCGDGGLHFHIIMKRLSDRNNNNHYHHGGGRSKRNKVKKGGTFFSEITNVLTSHKALSGNVAKNKEYMNRRTCICNLKTLEIPQCPTIPEQFLSVSEYYKLHLRFTLHEACYLVKKKLEESPFFEDGNDGGSAHVNNNDNNHHSSNDNKNNNNNNGWGNNNNNGWGNKNNNNNNNGWGNNNNKNRWGNKRKNNNNNNNNNNRFYSSNQRKRFQRKTIEGRYFPSYGNHNNNNNNNNGGSSSFGNNLKDHRKTIPTKVNLIFKITHVPNNDDRLYKDTARAQCIVLIHCNNKMFLAACSGDERNGRHKLTFESCECAYYFFEDKNFNFQGTPVYFEPITSVLNLKRMNDVCRHAPSLGKYTNQILGWRNGVHTKFDDSDDDEAEVVFIKTESGKKEQNNNRNNEVEASVNNNSNNNGKTINLILMSDNDDDSDDEDNDDELHFATLNTSQNSAVNFGLDKANSLVLLQGPPGTGKTYTISVLLEQLYKSGLRVGICASTNKAVHVAMEQFVNKFKGNERSKLNISLIGVDESIPKNLQEFFVHYASKKFREQYQQLQKLTEELEDISLQENLDEEKLLQKVLEISSKGKKFFDIGIQIVKLDNQVHVFQSILKKLEDFIKDKSNCNPMRNYKISSLPQDVHILMCSMEHTLEDVLGDEQNIEGILLNSTQFLFLTLACCGRHSIRQTRKVDILICDEASQALEVETLIAMSLRPTKIILVGDPRQLSAIVQSQNAISKKFDRSLMSRLMDIRDAKYHMLDTQYRMHPKISKWPSKQYYNNLLRNANSVVDKKRNWKFPDGYQPLTFFNCNKGKEARDHTGSHKNEEEAERVIQIMSEIQKLNKNIQVKVITYYSAQVNLIRNKLHRKKGYSYGDARRLVITVDAFQGSEADVIILSFVRTQKSVGFLSDARRLNVSLTRAKDLLVIVGNYDQLKDCNSDDIKSLMKHVADTDAFYLDATERKRRYEAAMIAKEKEDAERKHRELIESLKQKQMMEEAEREERIKMMNEQGSCSL